jgi:hypothetical protein
MLYYPPQVESSSRTLIFDTKDSYVIYVIRDEIVIQYYD